MLMRYPMLLSVVVSLLVIVTTIMFISPIAVIGGSAVGAHIYVTELVKRDGIESLRGIDAGLRHAAVVALLLTVGGLTFNYAARSGWLPFLFADDVGAGGAMFILWIPFGLIVGIPISLIVSPLVADRTVRSERNRVRRYQMSSYAKPPQRKPPPTRNIDR